jgi:hypothetical protein
MLAFARIHRAWTLEEYLLHRLAYRARPHVFTVDAPSPAAMPPAHAERTAAESTAGSPPDPKAVSRASTHRPRLLHPLSLEGPHEGEWVGRALCMGALGAFLVWVEVSGGVPRLEFQLKTIASVLLGH